MDVLFARIHSLLFFSAFHFSHCIMQRVRFSWCVYVCLYLLIWLSKLSPSRRHQVCVLGYRAYLLRHLITTKITYMTFLILLPLLVVAMWLYGFFCLCSCTVHTLLSLSAFHFCALYYAASVSCHFSSDLFYKHAIKKTECERMRQN